MKAEKTLKISEHQLQASYFDWVRVMEKQDPTYSAIFAIPNGGMRDIRTAVKLKKEGVRAGVWDVHIPISKDGWAGMWIEMKVKPNKLTPEQKAFGALMQDAGHKLAVAYSFEEARAQTLVYLEGE